MLSFHLLLSTAVARPRSEHIETCYKGSDLVALSKGHLRATMPADTSKGEYSEGSYCTAAVSE